MKPAMERLMFEILTQVRCGGKDVISLEVLNQRFDADSPPKKERIRNAVARLCGAGHLKNRGGQYFFAKPIRNEPPRVDSLFPESVSIVREKSKITISKDRAVSVASARSQAEIPITRRKKAKKLFLRDWILKMLEDNEGFHASDEISKLCIASGVSKSDSSIKATLRKMFRKKLIARPMHGHYQAIHRTCSASTDSNGVHEASHLHTTHIPQAQICEEKSRKGDSSDSFASILKEDIAHFELLITGWKDNLTNTEREAVFLKRRIQEYERLVLRREQDLIVIISGEVEKATATETV